MIGQEFVCALETCDNKATKTTHNQKYCSGKCCQIATNKRLMERYHERAAIKKGKKRVCRSCKITTLSRYNPTPVCASCETSSGRQDNELTRMLASVVSV